jgi:predicted  nucleic acid-binding Zn-ribbon protein
MGEEMNKKLSIVMTILLFVSCFKTLSYCEDWRSDIELSAQEYISIYSEFEFLELLSARTKLEEDLARTYVKIFKEDPTQRIKIANYERILNKSIDTFNRVDVNAQVIDQADKQFESEFLPLAEKFDPDIRKKYAKAMAMDYCLLKFF